MNKTKNPILRENSSNVLNVSINQFFISIRIFFYKIRVEFVVLKKSFHWITYLAFIPVYCILYTWDIWCRMNESIRNCQRFVKLWFNWLKCNLVFRKIVAINCISHTKLSYITPYTIRIGTVLCLQSSIWIIIYLIPCEYHEYIYQMDKSFKQHQLVEGADFLLSNKVTL